MKKCKKLFSYSLECNGEEIELKSNIEGKPLFIGCKNSYDMAEACRVLASKMMELAHEYEHEKDFCAPEYDGAARNEQIEKMRKLGGIY